MVVNAQNTCDLRGLRATKVVGNVVPNFGRGARRTDSGSSSQRAGSLCTFVCAGHGRDDRCQHVALDFSPCLKRNSRPNNCKRISPKANVREHCLMFALQVFASKTG